MRVFRFALLLGVAAMALAGPVAAQRLVVDVRDSVLKVGIARVLVSAEAGASGARVYGITNDAGRTTLQLPMRGAWATSVRRIGILPARATAVTVDTRQTVSIVVSTTGAQFRLPAVQVTAAAPACARQPEGDGRAAVLWEQMTLALRASAVASLTGEPLQVRMFERELDRNRTLRAERSLHEGSGTGRPFYAAPPDSLIARGFVQRDAIGGTQYYALDETVMLSDGFVATHCFAAPASTRDSSLAELRFEPIRGRTIADVAGTAFIDATTGELRRIEFRYVNVDRLFQGRRPDAGGDVALRRLRDGRWIVSDWSIRMPTYMGVPGRVDLSFTGYREVGGSIRVLSDSGDAQREPRGITSSRSDSLVARTPIDATTAARRAQARTIEERTGFMQRRDDPRGVFLDAEAVARASAQTALQLLDGITGVTLFTVPADVPEVPAEGDPDLSREWRVGAELPMLATGTGSSGNPRVCLVKVYLDGARASLSQLVALSAQDVAALEFYRLPRDVPAGYRRDGNRCGTAMFWSFGAR